MTPTKCPLVFECPKVWQILERYPTQQSIKKVNSMCAVCSGPEFYGNSRSLSKRYSLGKSNVDCQPDRHSQRTINLPSQSYLLPSRLFELFQILHLQAIPKNN